jgi:hypothetical protein
MKEAVDNKTEKNGLNIKILSSSLNNLKDNFIRKKPSSEILNKYNFKKD